ncbi:hypothetical protein EJ08DRAFT_582635 [Tothia fuscella]|uniref:BTB domain-containing protein n=1 Tax=Tothia fuscella TaxID=1048955 RepID=A0A9P4NXI3_9PEZI|nr:hypothetical protein EJ08DRAFT_582635 [Tothia fuscella]
MALLADDALPQAEKDGDDPTTPTDQDSPPRNNAYATPTSLARLLASHSVDSPPDSRPPSYTIGNGNLVRRSPYSGTATLSDHLYTRGLLAGRHSDVSIIVFGHRYNLHRLILDRAPFFTTAFSGPWLESKAKEIILHPEEIDGSITRKAFELALKKLYGCDISDEEDEEAVGLFATGCWLEMHDVMDSAIESILRQMSPETLTPIIKIVTNNYYGRAGERILASAKAMLCRDGWEMPLRCWDGISGEIVREIVGGDGFYINSEWERWILTKRLLDRRLKFVAIECGLIDVGNRKRIKAPDTLGLNAVRYDAVYRKNSIMVGGKAPKSQHDRWISLYTHSDIEPLLVLLDEGIHYIHLEFEQLQYIRQARDIFGLPLLPDRVVSNALWQQIELRQRVVNAREGDLELGLSQPAETLHRTQRSVDDANSSSTEETKGKQKVTENSTFSTVDDEDELDSGSWDANAQPRKFWIPNTDCNIVMGGNAEPVITTSTTSTFLRLASRMSATLDPVDVLWATDFAASPSTNVDAINRPTTPANANTSGDDAGQSPNQPKPITYSRFPPFRFAVEFPNPKSLKEKKRVYSRTVFYAGSLWNIYIHKVRTAKNPQLGVYLHRVKQRENQDGSIIGGPGGGLGGTVDERIGLFEREMRLRTRDERVLNRRGQASSDQRHSDITGRNLGSANPRGSNDQDDGSMAAFRRRTYGDGGGMLDTSYTAFDSEDSDSSDSPLHYFPTDITSLPPSLTQFPPPSNARHRLASESTSQPKRAPALPPYTDARPTIKTYFKIYSPSKGGRLLSVYESRPDKFDFSQSWGWKSSTLMLDEGFSYGGGNEKPGDMERERKRRKDGSLRFMIVIGNL